MPIHQGRLTAAHLNSPRW